MTSLQRLIAAASLAACGGAFAYGPMPASTTAPDDLQNLAPARHQTTTSRQAVRLELQALQKSGLYRPIGEASPGPLEAQRHGEQVASLLGHDEPQAVMSRDGDTTIVVLPDDSMVIIEVVPADEPNPGEAMPEPQR